MDIKRNKYRTFRTISFVYFVFICSIFIFMHDCFAQFRNTDEYQLRVVPGLKSPSASTYIIDTAAFLLTLRDNVTLDCSKFYPGAPDPINFPNGYPVVIMCHGYGESKGALSSQALSQASYGYVVYTYSMRGQGVSGGLSNLISSIEAQDLFEVVNYVKHDYVIGSDTSKILIEGGSQGGMIPYMAACMGLRVTCIISDLSSPLFASSWIENGSIKMTYLWTITYTPDIARYDTLVTAMQGWVYANILPKNMTVSHIGCL